jgi:hypothetical protein
MACHSAHSRADLCQLLFEPHMPFTWKGAHAFLYLPHHTNRLPLAHLWVLVLCSQLAMPLESQ